MDHLINPSPLPHRAPSVGSIIKKILAINPELTTSELIEMIRNSTLHQGARTGEFASAEVIDENRALELGRASLRK